ncbi:hypothetical protein E2C01_075503 [Portunus trituberculatus]|uniref:Uncharacterized protein n=1 Tax=Portunus trituberculatus TaxID=210409 RepID=A0A5B7IFZ5_PORTR|nr:hypothetical protein [Portunus trituberculatus]
MGAGWVWRGWCVIKEGGEGRGSMALGEGVGPGGASLLRRSGCLTLESCALWDYHPGPVFPVMLKDAEKWVSEWRVTLSEGT